MPKVQVECIAVMSHKKITPLRIRYEVSDESHVVKIDKVLLRDSRAIPATTEHQKGAEHIFKCEAIQNGLKKPFTLTFNCQTLKWHMHI